LRAARLDVPMLPRDFISRQPGSPDRRPELVGLAVNEFRAGFDRYRPAGIMKRVDAAAKTVARFQDRYAQAGRGQPARCRQSGRSRAEYDDVSHTPC